MSAQALQHMLAVPPDGPSHSNFGSCLPQPVQELAEEMEDLHDATDEVLASLHKVMGC